jgi:hypothetical protein
MEKQIPCSLYFPICRNVLKVPLTDLESIIALAKHDRKEITRLRCDAWVKAN